MNTKYTNNGIRGTHLRVQIPIIHYVWECFLPWCEWQFWIRRHAGNLPVRMCAWSGSAFTWERPASRACPETDWPQSSLAPRQRRSSLSVFDTWCQPLLPRAEKADAIWTPPTCEGLSWFVNLERTVETSLETIGSPQSPFSSCSVWLQAPEQNNTERDVLDDCFDCFVN